MAGVALGVRLHRRALDRDLASGVAASHRELAAGALNLAAQWLDAGE